MNIEYLYRFLRLLLIVCICMLFLFIIYSISKVAYPFIIGGIIALFINPMVNFLEKKAKFKRGIAVLITLVVLMAALSGIVLLLVKEMMTGFAYLASSLPAYIRELAQFVEDFFKSHILPLYKNIHSLFNSLEESHQQKIMDNIGRFGTNISTTVGNVAQAVINGLSSIIVSLPNFLTVFVFSLLAAFFISKDWYRLLGLIQKFCSDKVMKSSQSVFNELKKALVGFIKAQLTLISFTTCIVLIGLLLLKIEYAITISIIIGAVDLLPYLGTGTVFVPWIAYCFFTGDYPLTIGLAILYGVVIVQRQIMEPKILSSSIGLDPLATLIALFVGFQWYGFLGLIIGPVLLVIIRALYLANVFHELYAFIMKK
ncbi:sporulation integral membrane protein YtvI [Fictibacillus sp. Mic-4]|uniref:sporulation integral membrane protein YtvI n=1 Tax=Fictibacillus sp. Mic-4 TaxID=3132826 RepID=UPI003CEACACA